MFSFQQRDELVFQVPSISFQERTIQKNPQEDRSQKAPNGRKRGWKSLHHMTEDMNGGDHKKMMHREIERHRRQEMAGLYSQLRSLLPLDFIKGKRSISDHMQESVKYINHMQKNIKELSFKRDKLKKTVESSIDRGRGEAIRNRSSATGSPTVVSVNLCLGGVEVSINSCSAEEGFSLSRVLKVLADDGLSVTSYNSARVNDRLIHTVQCDICGGQAFIEPAMLQQKLEDVVKT